MPFAQWDDVLNQGYPPGVQGASDLQIHTWALQLRMGLRPPDLVADFANDPIGQFRIFSAIRDILAYDATIAQPGPVPQPPRPPPSPITTIPVYFSADQSGIQLDADKENSRPGVPLEIEGYRSDLDMNGDHEITRVFLVPWSAKDAWEQWWMGWSTNTVPDGSGAYQAEPVAGWVSLVAAQAGIIKNGKISRVIPAQHPEKPWFYVAHIRLVQGVGVLDRRFDISIRKNARGLPFISFEDLTNAAPDRIDFSQDGAVQTALAEFNTANQLVQAWTTFPVLSPPGGVLWADLLNALQPGLQPSQVINLPDQQQSDLADLRQALQSTTGTFRGFSVAGLAGQNQYARTFTNYVLGLQDRLRQATIALSAAQDAAFQNARTRQLVPMVKYSSRDPATSIPNQDGFAMYEVTYRPRKYRIHTDRAMVNQPELQQGELERYVERNMNWSVKAVQVPGQLTFYEGPFLGTKVPIPGAVVVPLGEASWIWLDVPDLPINILQVQGKVNLNDFDGALGAVKYSAGTLLLQQPIWHETPRSVRGRVLYRIELRALVNLNGWNKFPAMNNVNGINYYGASTDGFPPANNDVNLVYKRFDFNQLFQVPLPVAYQVSGRG